MNLKARDFDPEQIIYGHLLLAIEIEIEKQLQFC